MARAAPSLDFDQTADLALGDSQRASASDSRRLRDQRDLPASGSAINCVLGPAYPGSSVIDSMERVGGLPATTGYGGFCGGVQNTAP
jgi:hypothetical protein